MKKLGGAAPVGPAFNRSSPKSSWFLGQINIPNQFKPRLNQSFRQIQFRSIKRIFKASALWADAFYKSKFSYVCVFVCVFVRHTFSLRLTVFLPPLPEVQCPNFLDFRNPWGKVMERSGLRFENFCS